jgi:SAM-dependent methyltransferase
MRAIFIFLLLNALGYAMDQQSHEIVSINPLRRLLTIVRGGDFAHPGETQAIDFMIEKVILHAPWVTEGKALSLGCGFGGTEDYIQKKFNVHHIEGLDIDSQALAYIKQTYQDILTTEGDMKCLDQLYEHDEFSFVYSFSSFYAVDNHSDVLEKIHTVLKDDGILMLFDYSVPFCSHELEIRDFAGKVMYPIAQNTIDEQLQIHGFHMVEKIDLSIQFCAWYDVFLEKLVERQEENMLSHFTQGQIDQIRDTFKFFKDQISNKDLGGIGIIVKKVGLQHR